MKVKKIPMRMCCVTKERFPKHELLRIVKTIDGIIVDETGKVNGHGAYIKKDINVLLKDKKIKALERTLGYPISDEIYEQIINIINKK